MINIFDFSSTEATLVFNLSNALCTPSYGLTRHLVFVHRNYGTNALNLMQHFDWISRVVEHRQGQVFNDDARVEGESVSIWRAVIRKSFL